MWYPATVVLTLGSQASVTLRTAELENGARTKRLENNSMMRTAFLCRPTDATKNIYYRNAHKPCQHGNDRPHFQDLASSRGSPEDWRSQAAPADRSSADDLALKTQRFLSSRPTPDFLKAFKTPVVLKRAMQN